MAEIFQPVRGYEDKIARMPIREGYVYFAYDTGNIYMDKTGARYLMGGSSTGIIYAKGNDTNIINNNPEDDANTEYTLAFSALEDPNTIPLINSLILNADGRFFRVISVDKAAETANVLLLAVSGSGGSGGSGGDGPIVTTRDVDISWDTSTITTGRIYIYGQSYNAVFVPTTTAVGDTACNVTFIVNDRQHNTTETFVKNNVPSGSKVYFDTSVLPESSNISLQVVVTSDNSQYNNGLGYQRNITSLRTVRMELEKPVKDAYIPIVKADGTGNLTLRYRPIGDESLSLKVHTYVDDVEIGSGTDVLSSYLNQSVPITIGRQTHGVHTIKFDLSTEISGNTVYSNSIEYEGAWAAAGNTDPVIWIGNYDETIINYENSYINYMVFDPVNYGNGMPADVHLYKEGIEVSQIEANYSDDAWLVWDISNLYTVGSNNFAIVCGGTRVNILINVTTEGSRELGLIATDSLMLNMTAAGRSSAEIKRNRGNFYSTVNTDTIVATLSNFNWQNNGWKDSDGIDENGVDSGAYLSIANGAGLSVEMAGNGLVLNGQKDYTFELRFRVKNVQEYSTLVRTIPKYYYEIPSEEDPDVFIPQYTLLIQNGETQIISSANPRSLYESEIIERGYRIGTDQYGNLLMDEENSFKTVETEKGVVVKWINSDGYGFCIGTQEAYFKTPSGTANVRYCEDEVINIAMVASKSDSLCYIYLNGILAGAIPMPTGSGASFIINSPFVFNSNYCDFDLYRFRIYELGLTMPQVIHNYLSDMHSIVLYDQNQITEPLDATALSYDLLVKYNEDNPNALSMPYATWQITDGTDELLPWKKGNNRVATIDFVNPSLDAALEAGLISEWFYYTHCPSFHAEGVDINVQGTSSQKYPRRNYKTKYKSAKEKWVYTKGSLAGKPLTEKYKVLDENGVEHTLAKKYHMDTEDFGTNKFTWKIDYMESSATYNTGFANLMGNLVHPLYTKHPLDDLNLGIDTSDMRTTVYGFPVLTFHKYANGRYEYIGRYNMNLDKGSNEYYGFEDGTEQPYVEKRKKMVQNKETNEWEEIEYQPTIEEIAECWELKDNQGTWCSFKYPDEASRAAGFMTLKEGTSGDNAQLELLNHFEYRYSFYGDELDAAYDYTKFTDGNTRIEYSNNGQINQYLYEKHKNLEIVFNWLDSTNPDAATNTALNPPVTYNVASKVDDDDSITYTLVSEGSWNAKFTKDTREYRRQKFRAEFDDHFDREYCLTYAVLTELLLCYDSRGKNLMMATFGPHKKNGNYIWYPIFYDIDTQLGLNNSGAYLWDYDADVTKENLFSTPTSALWNNLYDVFYDDIVQKYRVLRGVSNPSNTDSKINGSLTYENIAGAYECNPNVFNSYAMRGVRPIVAIGLDEYYKYLAPALKKVDFDDGKLYAGYYDTTGSHLYQPTPTYVYACQGDKKLTTELLLRNRLNYIDSWWLGGDYRAGVVENQIFIRANANERNTSDSYLDSETLPELPAGAASLGYSLKKYPVDFFDARPGAKIKPFLHQYVSYFMDSQPSVPVKYDGSAGQEDGVWTNVDSGKEAAFKTSQDLTQQITYIPGGDYISSLGDISLMYPNSLQIFHGQRLLDFKLGSDIPGYKNPLINSSSDWELAPMPLLKSVNISKLGSFNRELDFTGSAKLQEFRALGSIIERVNFAAGAPLHTVHLPATMTTLSLVQCQNLTEILTSAPEVVRAEGDTYVYNNPDTYRGLYLEKVTDYTAADANSGHNLNTYEVVGGGLGYNSYIILRNLYNLKANASTKETLSIGLTDVEWTPYIAVEKGENYLASETYYLLNDHSSYEPFTFVSNDDWDEKVNNSLIYTYNKDYTHNEEETITDLSLLDNFIAKYEQAVADGTLSQFRNLTAANEATRPTITGNLYVSNTSATPIVETKLTDVYKKHFPYLNVTAKYVKESNVTKYVKVYETTGIVETIEALRSDNEHPLPPSDLTFIPSKAGYDFIGWSTDAAGNNMFINYNINVNTGIGSYDEAQMNAALNSYTFDISNTVLTLYAQFQVHKNIIVIYDGNERIGAALANNGSTFVEPTEIYKYVNDQIDTSVSYPYIPYKDDSNLPLTKTYKFMGYSKNSADTTENTDPVTGVVKADMTIYSVFAEASVYDSVADESYFTTAFTAGNWTIRCVRTDLKGKITVPKTVNGITPTVFNYLDNSTPLPEVTHVFFEGGNEEGGSAITTIGSYAFNNWVNLRYVALPKGNLINIGQSAFYRTAEFGRGISQDDLDDFFRKIATIDQSGLSQLGVGSQFEGYKSALVGKTFDFANIQHMSDTACATVSVGKIIVGSETNRVNALDWQAEKIFNATYKDGFSNAGYSANRRPDFTYYHSGNELSPEDYDALYITFRVESDDYNTIEYITAG